MNGNNEFPRILLRFNRKELSSYIFLLIVLKVLVGFLVAFSLFDLPHVWREIDTMAVAMRYFQRWWLGLDAMPLVPAVLNSGGGIGYMPMEFPILNIIVAPWFVLGPYLGKVMACLTLFICHGLLFYGVVRAYKGIHLAGADARLAFLLLPVVGISSVFSLKFIPDTLATLLVTLGLGLCWKIPKTMGIILMGLGILIKPPAVVVLLLCLAKDDFLAYFKRYFYYGIPILLPAGLYYTMGISWLKGLQDGTGRFFVEMRPPLDALMDFLALPFEILRLVFDKLLFPFAPILMVPFFRKKQTKLLLVLTLQLLTIGLLDGDHAFAHNYYFMGLMPTATLILQPILWQAFSCFSKSYHGSLVGKVAGILLFTVFFVSGLERLSFQARAFFVDVPPQRAASFAACEQLKRDLPDLPWDQNFGFMTNPHPYPRLGVCFGERVGFATAKFGFYTVDETVPHGCQSLGEREGVMVVGC